MKTSISLRLVVIAVIALTALYGCPKSAEVGSAPEATVEESAKAEEARKAEVAAAAAAEAVRTSEEERAAKAKIGLQSIYFDFDKTFVDNDARLVMQANAEYLKANPNVNIRIEGNCDDRGTVEYNQVLGQRRSSSAKQYLVNLGIASRRISLISYGKEKPVCQDGSEECWQKNRRADLVPAS